MNPLDSFRPVTPPLLPARPKRSMFITVFAWCVMIASALMSLVSATALLMLLAGSHGSANAKFGEGLIVIGVPPVTLIAGVGLLRRWRWAFGYVLVLLACIAMWNVAQIVRGPTPQHTYTSPGGVPTTVLATQVNYPAHLLMVAVSLGLLATLLTKSVRAEFR